MWEKGALRERQELVAEQAVPVVQEHKQEGFCHPRGLSSRPGRKQ
jgi:hypothetical protein